LAQSGAPSAGALELSDVLRQIESANPELASLKARTEASEFDVAAEPALPPPVFEINSMGTSGPIASDGHMETSYRVRQELIFPTKVLSRKSALSRTSEGLFHQRSARWRERTAEARKAYVDYWAASARSSLLEERSRILHEHTKRLKAAPLSSKRQQAHIVEAETDREIALAELEEAKEGVVVARGTLNALMGKDAWAELGPPRAPVLAPLPASPKDGAEAAMARHPKLLALGSEVAASESLRSAARSEYFPNVMIEYWRNRRFDNTPDTTELAVGVSVPFLYFWQPRAMSQAAGARVVEKEAALDQARNDFRLKLLKAHAELASLRARSLAYESKVLPGAARRLKISHSLAATDMESLVEHRDSIEGELLLKLKALELRASYERALADYESLVGHDGKDGGAS
jgi:outer membrane protein TolC